jgi:hypothetical protein
VSGRLERVHLREGNGAFEFGTKPIFHIMIIVLVFKKHIFLKMSFINLYEARF